MDHAALSQSAVLQGGDAGFAVFNAGSLDELWAGLSDRPRRLERAYRFEGKDYPNYQVLAATVFEREKPLERCPKPGEPDAQFTRSYFWWTHVAVQRNESLFDLIADLQATLAAKGKRLHVVLLPANLEVIDKFEPSWRRSVSQRQQHMAFELKRRGVNLIDLSGDFTPEEFSTWWCACIHFNDRGRLHLASAIAADLRPDRNADNLRRQAAGIARVRQN